MTDSTMSFGEAKRHANRIKEHYLAVAMIAQVLETAGRAESEVAQLQGQKQRLIAECGQLEQKKEDAKLAAQKAKEDAKINVERAQADASAKKAELKKDLDDFKADCKAKRQHEADNLQEYLTDVHKQKQALKEELSELETKRANAQRTISGLRSRLEQVAQ